MRQSHWVTNQEILEITGERGADSDRNTGSNLLDVDRRKRLDKRNTQHYYYSAALPRGLRDCRQVCRGRCDRGGHCRVRYSCKFIFGSVCLSLLMFCGLRQVHLYFASELIP